jgi:hypothetical protein
VGLACYRQVAANAAAGCRGVGGATMAIGDFVKLRRVVWVATLLGLALTAAAQEPPREAGPFRQPELVEMPSEYDEMTERSHISYRGGSEAARHLRDMLRTAMEAEGFAVYEPEWWHYDYKDWQKYPILNIGFSEIPKPATKTQSH